MIKKILTIIIATAILCLALTSAFAENKIHIGILPFYSSDKIWLFYKPFIDYLNKTTGIAWELKLYYNYDAFVNGICKGEFSIGYLGPIPFGQAHEKCKVKPLLVTLNSDGKPFYRSVIFSADKSIGSVEDLKGKKIAFGIKSSTAAHVVPRKMLEDKGITMDMIKPVLFKNHADIINAVLSGQAEAGAVKESGLKTFGPLSLKKLMLSELIPHHTFCASPNINTDIEKRFINALLKLKPLKNIADKEITKNWDPELKYGFALPPEKYIQEATRLLQLYKKYNP
jgi:phosphonate transport system substrate-binding protein